MVLALGRGVASSLGGGSLSSGVLVVLDMVSIAGLALGVLQWYSRFSTCYWRASKIAFH